MGKIAVVSVLIGERHKNIANLTHPTQIRYAHKIGADYLVYDSINYKVISPDGSVSEIPSTNPVVPRNTEGLTAPAFGAYNKLNIVELLKHYDRVLHVDTDIIIRNDAPNLFEIVPKDSVGIVSESDFIKDDDRGQLMQEWADTHNISLKKWNRRYYNTGVFLFSQGHEKMLNASNNFYDDTFYEQTLININMYLNNLKIYELPPDFNRMTFMDGLMRIARHNSYFIHYAGSWMMLKDGHNTDANFLIKLIQHDLDKWENDSPQYNYKKKGKWNPRSFWIRD